MSICSFYFQPDAANLDYCLSSQEPPPMLAREFLGTDFLFIDSVWPELSPLVWLTSVEFPKPCWPLPTVQSERLRRKWPPPSSGILQTPRQPAESLTHKQPCNSSLQIGQRVEFVQRLRLTWHTFLPRARQTTNNCEIAGMSLYLSKLQFLEL